MTFSYKTVLEFIKKYFLQYIVALIIPFIILIVCFIVMGATVTLRHNFNTYLLLGIDLVSLGFMVWALWKAFLVGYSLNYASYAFLKQEEEKPLKEHISVVKKESGAIIKFLTYMALLFCGVIILTSTFAAICINLTNADFQNSKIAIIISTLSMLLFAPFAYYSMTAFFFRNHGEIKQGFWKLFKNCYKYLNFKGILIIICAILTSFLINLIPYISPILSLIVAMIFAIINVNWYYNRIKKD